MSQSGRTEHLTKHPSSSFLACQTGAGVQEIFFKTLDDLIQHFKKKNQGLATHLRRSVKRKTILLMSPRRRSPPRPPPEQEQQQQHQEEEEEHDYESTSLATRLPRNLSPHTADL